MTQTSLLTANNQRHYSSNMTIGERVKAESTKIGKICKTWIAGLLALCSSVAMMGEYFNMLPPVIALMIPNWLKGVVLAAGVISFIYGHWTVKPKENEQV